MKKTKRIISVILLLAMLGTVVTVFSGCGLFTKKVVGTEAAKILLARERLDGEALVGAGDILSISSSTEDESGGFFSNIFPWANVGSASVVGGIAPIVAKVAAGAERTNDSVTWSGFETTSDLKASYAQFIEPIDQMAAETAELIAEIKEDVGITDKWVDTMLAKYMLIVDENSETIIEYYKPYESVSVSTRYTTDDAKCVYEMYSFVPYDDGTVGEIRNKCIPGEYYEYTFQNGDDIDDYFIADKSNGYWMMNRFGVYEEGGATFDTSAVKDGVGYGALVSTYEDDGKLKADGDYLPVSVFRPYEDRDLVEISAIDGNYTITVFMSNIESGIRSLSVDQNSFSEEEYGSAGTVYLHGNGEENASAVAINLSNGKTINAGDGNGKVMYTGARINYNLFFGPTSYVGRLSFSISADSVGEAYGALTDYLSDNGVTLNSSKSEIVEAYSHCVLLRDNFDIMEWNGYRMSSTENLRAAEQKLEDDYAKYYGLYETVKDNETVSGSYDVAKSTTFGEMEILSKGSSKYAGGSIIVEGLTARTESTKLLEAGEEYTLKIGLALRDGEGNISSVNTVSLHSENETTVTYTDGALEISQTAEYVVPTALSEGEYIVVVYFATAEDGIRVTEMFPVAFFSAEEGTLDSDVMDITVKKSGESLFIDYEVKLSDTVEADYAKNSYTYDEIENILLRGVLAKGYPASGAVVQTESGNELSETGTYGAGTYRLKYLVNTDQGLVEAYMYCTLDTVTAN